MAYANDDPFLTADDLTAYLKLPVALDPDDLGVRIALDAACSTIRETVDQLLDYVQDETILVDSNGTDTILLPELPVREVTDVSVAGVTLTEGTDYFVDFKQGALVTKGRGRRWLPGRGVVEVTYSHGWDSIPNAARIIALTLAARIYDQGLVRQESVGGVQVIYAASESLGLSEREKSLLVKTLGIGRRSPSYASTP